MIAQDSIVSGTENIGDIWIFLEISNNILKTVTVEIIHGLSTDTYTSDLE